MVTLDKLIESVYNEMAAKYPAIHADMCLKTVCRFDKYICEECMRDYFDEQGIWSKIEHYERDCQLRDKVVNDFVVTIATLSGIHIKTVLFHNSNNAIKASLELMYAEVNGR